MLPTLSFAGFLPAVGTIEYLVGMRLSVSLPTSDVQFLDEFAKLHGLKSRSAALQQAVRALRTLTLPEHYRAAWDEWTLSDDSQLWELVASDGLSR